MGLPGRLSKEIQTRLKEPVNPPKSHEPIQWEALILAIRSEIPSDFEYREAMESLKKVVQNLIAKSNSLQLNSILIKDESLKSLFGELQSILNFFKKVYLLPDA